MLRPRAGRCVRRGGRQRGGLEGLQKLVEDDLLGVSHLGARVRSAGLRSGCRGGGGGGRASRMRGRARGRARARARHRLLEVREAQRGLVQAVLRARQGLEEVVVGIRHGRVRGAWRQGGGGMVSQGLVSGGLGVREERAERGGGRIRTYSIWAVVRVRGGMDRSVVSWPGDASSAGKGCKCGALELLPGGAGGGNAT